MEKVILCKEDAFVLSIMPQSLLFWGENNFLSLVEKEF